MSHKIRCTHCRKVFERVPGMECSVSDPTDLDTQDDRYGDHPRWLGNFCPECLPVVMDFIHKKEEYYYLLSQMKQAMREWMCTT